MTTFDFGFGPVAAHQHPNGGGWVADTAHVDDSVYVGPRAWVYENARLFFDARITGESRVFGSCLVSDGARVSGRAQVFGSCWVSGGAKVSGKAQVFGNAWVYGKARVFGRARVFGCARVSKKAWVFYKANVSDHAYVQNTWVFIGYNTFAKFITKYNVYHVKGRRKLKMMLKPIGIGILILFGVLSINFALMGLGLVQHAFFAPMFEQVRRDTFEQSKAYNQGMQQELRAMQFEYIQASEEHKLALKSVIRHRFADYDHGKLPQDLQQFMQEMNHD